MVRLISILLQASPVPSLWMWGYMVFPPPLFAERGHVAQGLDLPTCFAVSQRRGQHGHICLRWPNLFYVSAWGVAVHTTTGSSIHHSHMGLSRVFLVLFLDWLWETALFWILHCQRIARYVPKLFILAHSNSVSLRDKFIADPSGWEAQCILMSTPKALGSSKVYPAQALVVDQLK